MRDEVLVEVVRGGLVESEHRGSLVVLDAAGQAVTALGDPAAPMFPRSSSKPMQAVGMVEAGLRLEPELLALVCASHSGGPEHLAGVERILAGVGRSADDLQCILGLPLGTDEQAAFLRAGGEPSRLAFNCSGKHAGFIATSVHNGWPLTSHLEPDHPVQRACLAAVERLAGESVSSTTVDGCGAPLFAISLRGLANAFRAIAIAPAATPEGDVATAMRSHPAMVGGRGREVTIAMEQVPGLIAKDGAEAVLAMALPDGRAMAVKISDGGRRGVQQVLAAVLDVWGVCTPERLMLPTVLGGGRPVGTVLTSVSLRNALDALS